MFSWKMRTRIGPIGVSYLLCIMNISSFLRDGNGNVKKSNDK